ncbi:MAG: radical SAM protein [Clostridia bacterium]|nr:radical SAM protein [Clostridia bacterium]
MDGSTVFSLAPEARIIHADDSHFIIDPIAGSWVKLPRYAGILCEKACGQDADLMVDRVDIIYGGRAAGEFRGLLEELSERGLMVCTKGREEHSAQMTSGHTSPCGPKVYLSVTDECNLRCITCYRTDGATSGRTPTRVVTSTIRRVSELDPAELIITGGEPTTRDDLPELLMEARESCPRVILATNGTLISDSLAAAIAQTGVAVQISLESADERAHDLIRGRGSYARTIAGLERLSGMGVERIELVSTIADPSLFEPEPMMDLAGRYGASFHASLFMEVGRGACARFATTADPGAFARSMVRYLLQKAKGGMIAADATFDEVIGVTPRFGCGAGSFVLGVSENGGVYPCHLAMNPEFRVELDELLEALAASRDAGGRWFPGTLANLWSWKEPNVDSIDVCFDCDVRYFCGGGCRAAAYAATGDIGGRDPMCRAYMLFLSCLLWNWDDAVSVEDNLSVAWAEISGLQ